MRRQNSEDDTSDDKGTQDNFLTLKNLEQLYDFLSPNTV